MKICKKCNTEKDISYFKEGRSECKACIKTRTTGYYRTKSGLVKQMYYKQISSSKKRGHPLPTYTREELKEWLYSQPKFHTFFDNWKRLDFQKEYIPSVDRKNNYIGYTMSNIQLMTWAENKKQADDDRVLGKLITSQNKRVAYYFKDGVKIASFHSIKEAERVTGVSRTSISKACNGDLKTAGGYIWKFKG